MNTPRDDGLQLHRTPTGHEISAALEASTITWDDQVSGSITPQNGLSRTSSGERSSSDEKFTENGMSRTTSADKCATNSSRRSRLPASKAWTTYFMQEVAGDRYLEAQLLLMTLATGVLDAMTVSTYRVFTSKQTGNTLWLALYAFRSPALAPQLEQNVAVSMAVFIGGAIFFGHLGHISRQRRRIWLLISCAFQAILIAVATIIRYYVSRQDTGPGAMGIIALLAFAESGQIATALNVNMPDVNTTMVTGAIIQLCSDRDFFKLHNRKRDRRVMFFISLLVGCFIGASLVNQANPSVALLVVMIIKVAIIVTFFFNKGMVEQKTQLEDGQEKVSGAATPVSRILWGD